MRSAGCNAIARPVFGMTEIIPSAEMMSSYLWDTTLASRGLRLHRLARLLHLREHFTNGCVGPGDALLAPGFEAIAMLFEVAEELRAAEHRAPRDDQRLHLFPDAPLLPVAFEETLFVDKASVYDARAYLPITEHHAHVCVFPAPRRTDTHQVLLVFCVKVGGEPLPRFAPPWLPPGPITHPTQN